MNALGSSWRGRLKLIARRIRAPLPSPSQLLRSRCWNLALILDHVPLRRTFFASCMRSRCCSRCCCRVYALVSTTPGQLGIPSGVRTRSGGAKGGLIGSVAMRCGDCSVDDCCWEALLEYWALCRSKRAFSSREKQRRRWIPVVAASCRGRKAPAETEVCMVYVVESHGGELVMLSSFWSQLLSRCAEKCASTSPELWDRGFGPTILCHLAATGAALGAEVRLFELLSDELRAVMRACVLLSL